MTLDHDLVRRARETAATAGPHQYVALCVLVERLCDEAERVARLSSQTSGAVSKSTAVDPSADVPGTRSTRDDKEL